MMRLRGLKAGRSFTICKFAKLLNYPRASDREFKRILKWLETNDVIAVQQGGFLGDSLHHPKIVAIRKFLELDNFKQMMLVRVNYMLGGYEVHRTRDKRRCDKCNHVIEFGERYGAKIKIGRSAPGKKHHVYFQSIICLPCLLERVQIEELERG